MTPDGPGGTSALPVPADDEVALLLQTVWDLLAGGDHWPSYRSIDRLLYRERRLDVDAVIVRTPALLLLGGRPQGGAAPQQDGQLSLTAAGAAACAGSGPALEVFLAAVRLAAEAELRMAPDGEEPAVTFEEAAAGAPMRGEDVARVARQSGLLLHAEPWTGYVLLYEAGWKLTVDRRARPYEGISDLGSYWAMRERQQRVVPTAEVQQPTQSSVVAGGGGPAIKLMKRWSIGEQLGSGGFGKVFLATGEDGTRAAAKFVPKTPGAGREMLFVRLDDVRNIVPIVDFGEAGDAWVLVMPLAERSLQDRLDAAGPLPVGETLAVLRDVATALSDLAALDTRVVHRDIKPANVLLLGDAWCLADFGISRYAEASTAPDTHKHAMSPPYAAPERWRAERATAAADVYAVGVMAHELLSGRRPFPGPGPEDYRDQHLHADPPRLNGAPPRLAALVEECLYKSPEARPSPANLTAGWSEQARLTSST